MSGCLKTHYRSAILTSHYYAQESQYNIFQYEDFLKGDFEVVAFLDDNYISLLTVV